MSHKEDLYDITTAASAAEAEILEAANSNKAKAAAGVPAQTQTQTQTQTHPTSGNEKAFPPVDIFASPSHWTLHFSVAGAKKGDVTVAWDEGKSAVAVRGVVNLARGGGEEEGLGILVASERRIGGFERVVKVPPVGGREAGGKGRVDGEGVESWLEDGVLVVRVPRKGVRGA